MDDLDYEYQKLSTELDLIKSMLGVMDESNNPVIRKISKIYRNFMKKRIKEINDEYTDNEEERMFEDVL